MAISLQKGQKISLSKETGGLSRLMIGLGWDPVKSSPKGLLGSLFGGGGQPNIDCDASVIMLDSNGKINSKKDIIYFGNLRSENESVMHMGDNLTGEGEGDDEQVFVDISKIPQNIKKLMFVVNIYDCEKRKQDFGLIENAFIRVLDASNNKELIRYNISESYAGKTALMVAEIYRHNDEWKFGAIGEGTLEKSLSEIVRKFS